MFKKVNTHDFVTLIYSFYQVQSGTKSFLSGVANDLTEKLDDQTTTYDLLRVLQAYS